MVFPTKQYKLKQAHHNVGVPFAMGVRRLRSWRMSARQHLILRMSVGTSQSRARQTGDSRPRRTRVILCVGEKDLLLLIVEQ